MTICSAISALCRPEAMNYSTSRSARLDERYIHAAHLPNVQSLERVDFAFQPPSYVVPRACRQTAQELEW
jgi:hypothetical protein